MTPISAPRFSKQNTWSTEGRCDSSDVRSVQASSTSRACRSLSEAKEASWSEVKQTTSQRPESPASEGKRFSKTTTSYEESGISLSRSPSDGHSGHSSAGG